MTQASVWPPKANVPYKIETFMLKEVVLRTAEAAKYLGIAASTLTKSRLKPSADTVPWVRLTSRRVGYLVRDLDAYLDARRHTGTADAG